MTSEVSQKIQPLSQKGKLLAQPVKQLWAIMSTA